jgi:hypothetical protein
MNEEDSIEVGETQARIHAGIGRARELVAESRRRLGQLAADAAAGERAPAPKAEPPNPA